MANSVSHASLPYPIKNARYTIGVPYLDSSGTPTDPTTPDTEVSQDGGAFADAAEEVTTISGSNGCGYVTLTGAETNNSLVVVAFKVASGPKATLATLYPRNLPVLASGTASAGASGSITLASSITYDITGCFVRTTGGTGGGGTGGANNQARRITAYNTSTQVATVTPNWETTPDNTTTYDVLLPEGVTAQMVKTVVPSSPGNPLAVAATSGGVTLADAVAHGGTLGSSTATLALSRLSVVSQSSNTNAVTATGNGTGHGAALTSGSGATGNGLTLLAASTNGHGLKSTGTGTGDGAELTAGASGADLDADVTGNVTGNLSGSVGSVTGAVGSVTGAVGSVTGNVGGNVTGSVGSVASGGITTASFAAGAINAAAIGADAITAAKIADGAIDTATFASGATIPRCTLVDTTTTNTDMITQANVRSAVGLASANLDTQLSAIAGYIDTEVATLVVSVGAGLNTLVSAVKAKTDNLPASPAATGDAMALTSGERNSVADALLDRIDAVETGITVRKLLRAAGAALAGQLSGAATATVVIKAINDGATTRITASVDADGNRSSVTLNL